MRELQTITDTLIGQASKVWLPLVDHATSRHEGNANRERRRVTRSRPDLPRIRAVMPMTVRPGEQSPALVADAHTEAMSSDRIVTAIDVQDNGNVQCGAAT